MKSDDDFLRKLNEDAVEMKTFKKKTHVFKKWKELICD